MFKNLLAYRIKDRIPYSPDDVAEKLAGKALRPCGAMEQITSGWVPVLNDQFVAPVGTHWRLRFGTEQRLLPAGVVREAVDAKATELTRQQGFKPTRRQLKELKEAVVAELLPKTLTQRKYTDVWIDSTGCWLGIDTSSTARADDVLGALIHAIEDMPLGHLTTATSPEAAMTQWLLSQEAPAQFTVDRECELKGCVEEKPLVKYARQSLERSDLRDHISEGKRPSQLALTWNDRLSFVLTSNFQIKKIAFLDIVTESVEESAEVDSDDPEAPGFLIMAGEFATFLPSLIEALGGEVATI